MSNPQHVLQVLRDPNMKRCHEKEAALSWKYVNNILLFDGEKLVWRINRGQRGRAGHAAGTAMRDGRIQVKIDGIKYLAYRLIYFIHYRKWPKAMLDHKGRDPTDNRIKNLRSASCEQNQYNAGLRIDNKSGYKGVVWHKATGKWAASISYKGKRIHLGLFDTPEKAHIAYVIAAKNLHGRFACIGAARKGKNNG